MQEPMTESHNGQPQARRPKYKGCFVWAGVIFIVFFSIGSILIVQAVYNRQPAVMASKEQKIQAELEQEFKAITPLSTQNLVKYSSCTANGNNGCTNLYGQSYVIVRASYTANSLMPKVVLDYYDQKLREQGWKFMGNSSEQGWDPTGKSRYILWGNDFPKIGSIYASFCKGKFDASLVYSQVSTADPWEYSLMMNWDSGTCKDKP